MPDMETGDVPPALRERLGEGATLGLVDLLDRAGRGWKADVLETAGDRFARVLAEESARIRTLMAEQGARFEKALATESARILTLMAEQGARLEARIVEQGARFDAKLAEQGARFDAKLAEQGARVETRLVQQEARIETRFSELEARLVGRMAELKADVLKWAFLFWIGQVAAMAALLAFMLHGAPR